MQTKKRMICFLDLDDVLVDFVSGVHNFYHLEYDESKYPYDFGDWNIFPLKSSSLSATEFWANFTERFWSDLSWIKDGKNLLKFLEQKFGCENICLLTAPMPEMSSACVTGKMRWIQKNLPKYSRQFLVGKAKHYCANENSILIDDADHNIDTFKSSGGKAILVPRLWNSKNIYAHDSYNFVCSELEKI